MAESIRNFLRTRFVDGDLTEGLDLTVRMEPYYLLIQAMRCINGDKTYWDFRQDGSSDDQGQKVRNAHVAAEKPYLHFESYFEQLLTKRRQEKENSQFKIAFDPNIFLFPKYLPEETVKNEFDRRAHFDAFVKGIRRETGEAFTPGDDAAEFIRRLSGEILKATANETDREQLRRAVESLVSDIEKKSSLRGDRTQIEREVLALIAKGGCRQIICTGAPGTGKTFAAKRIAGDLGTILAWRSQKDGAPRRYEFVQFHPSYDYTDFVEGLRPVEAKTAGGEGGFVFRRVDGIFKAFCRKVAEENRKDTGKSEKLYFFIIDEINRANLSKVFGELMYCLERDKRGEDNRVMTQYANLPTYFEDGGKEDVFDGGFFIPENVVIIGTMNDIDRSVDTIDFALRRRFEWREFKVKKETLREAFEAVDEKKKPLFAPVIKAHAEKLAWDVDALNKIIKANGPRFGLTEPEHYFISQGQFANLPEGPEDCEELDRVKKFVWEYRLESLLREYVRGEDPEEVEPNFILKAKKAFGVDK